MSKEGTNHEGPVVVETLVNSPKVAAERFVAAMMRAASVFRRTGSTIFDLTCSAYADEVGTVPGSNRTARLRKKRRKAVFQWLERMDTE